MTFLFWLLFVIDLLLVLLIISGSSFRASFGAGTDLNSLFLIVMIVIIVSSLIIRFAFRKPGLSTAILALPILAMFILYVVEEKTGR